MSVELSPMAAALQAQSSGRERTRIEVPEWSDLPCEGVLYSQVYTIKDDQIMGRFIESNDSAGFVEIMIRKAELENGEKAFHKADKPMLIRTADAQIVKRIAMEIVASLPLEEASGN